MLDSTRSRGTVPLRLQAALGSAAMLIAVPMTALRVVPVHSAHPTAPAVVALETPTPRPAVRPATITGNHPVTSGVRQPVSLSTGGESDSLIDRTLSASPGEKITIDLRTGGVISIVSWNQPQVRMRARLSGDQAHETDVTFERSAGGLSLRAAPTVRRNNESNSNVFELWVPARFDVDIASAGGSVTINTVQGRFSGQTGGGEIALNGVSGQASLSTGGGEVHITNSQLEGYVTTGGGTAMVENVTGGVRVSSGSGPVITTTGSEVRSYGINGVGSDTRVQGSTSTTSIGGTAIARASSIARAGGDIRVGELSNGGSYSTGGGDIVVGSVGGTASFTTGGGNITLDRVSDDVVATTGAGDVQISVINGNGAARNVTVHSGTGRVVIDLPANLDARFDVETAYTEGHGRTSITSDFSLDVNETQEWDARNGTPRRYVRGTGSVGSGRGLIKIRTVNGDVVIRRR